MLAWAWFISNPASLSIEKPSGGLPSVENRFLKMILKWDEVSQWRRLVRKTEYEMSRQLSQKWGESYVWSRNLRFKGVEVNKLAVNEVRYLLSYRNRLTSLDRFRRWVTDNVEKVSV